MGKIAATAVSATIAIAVGFLSVSGGSADSVFSSTSVLRMCNTLPVPFVEESLNGNPNCSENLTLGAAADSSIQMDLTGASVDLASQITFIPASVSITAGGSIPAGTMLGGVRQVTTFGFINGPCQNATTIEYVLFNVALPNNPGNPPASTNLAYPQAQGTVDRFEKWKVGSEPGGGDPSGIDPGADVAHAGGTSIPIQNYPKYLLDAFGNLIPRAAYGALTETTSEWQVLYLLQFDPGQLASLPGAYSVMNANMGSPLVLVQGDPTATLPSQSNITDTCAPNNINTMLLGQDLSSTHTRATSPASAGTAFFMQYLASDRDTDQDGFENTLDTCPLNPDVGSPKTGAGDADGDGVDDSCDPDFTPFPPDSDLDGFRNRQDNCPLVVNTLQEDSETAVPADKGPKTDAIGDACDSGAISITQNGHSLSLTASPSVSNGRYMTVTNIIPKCFGGTDADGDGYCTTQDTGADSGACTGTVPPSCAVRHNAWTGASHPALQGDTDGDGWSDTLETYLGGDPAKSCAQDGTASNETPFDNWPYDLNDTGSATITDVSTYSARFGLVVNVAPAAPRWDLNSDGLITILDVSKFSAVFGKTCAAAGVPAFSQQ